MKTVSPTKTVTRAELAEAIYLAAYPVTTKEARRIVGEVFSEISAALVRGEIVKISRFATFSTSRVPERLGRNPKRPAEEHVIPSATRVNFRAMPELKEATRKGDS